MRPIAYHITWTTYASWLSGDPRGWVKAGEQGIQPPDPLALASAAEKLSEPPVVLTDPQRDLVRATILAHASIREWQVHALNVRSNHVHVVVTADIKPEEVMNQFKAWCSRRLSEQAGRKRKWWTEHGSTKWINDDDYFASAIKYVTEGQ